MVSHIPWGAVACRIGLALFSTGLCGCGDGRPKVVPVSGQVLIEGKPITKGLVRIVPDHGRPASGEIDANGRFVLSTFTPGDGCMPGTHPVSVAAIEDVNANTRRWYAPKKYANAATSKLSATIDGPTDSLTFELQWDGEKGPFIEKTGGGE